MDIHKKLQNYIGKKSVCIVGISVEGVSTAKFLLKHHIPVTICDQKSKEELAIYEELLTKGAKFILGTDYTDYIQKFDIVFRTPGMPLWHQTIVNAKKHGLEITSHTKLFFKLCPSSIIGVTGTKGKGTTTTLITEILKAGGIKAYVGGNIGTPPLEFIDQLESSSYAVLELSSFQLEDLEKSPHVAIVLMTTQEHLASASLESPNYHRSIDEYLSAKLNIVKHQTHDDIAIFNADYEGSRSMVSKTSAKTYFFSKEKEVIGAYLKQGEILCLKTNHKEVIVGDVTHAQLKGRHNRENMMAASLVTYLLGIDPSIIYQTILGFKGLEHRLEFVRSVSGVDYYNDTFSTTPETTIAAIRAFPNKNIILIAGGSNKGSNYRELGKAIVESSVKSVLLIGDMANSIDEVIQEAGGGKEVIRLGKPSMKIIVEMANEKASDEDVVLLSPACASFDMFKNYKERGTLFKDEIEVLAAKSG